jgi:hypothetical protein
LLEAGAQLLDFGAGLCEFDLRLFEGLGQLLNLTGQFKLAVGICRDS